MARPISQLGDFVRKAGASILSAGRLALLETTVLAEGEAKRNAMRNFKGSRNRPKTGNLVNAIYSAFREASGKYAAEGFVGVRANKGSAGTRPYGRIQEKGGIVRPVRAKSLWIPLLGPKSSVPADLKNLTPSEFVKKMAAGGKSVFRGPGSRKAKRERKAAGSLAIITLPGGVARIAGLKVEGRRGIVKKFIAMFLLRQQVKIPPRPYVEPAVAKAMKGYAGRLKKHLAAERSRLK